MRDTDPCPGPIAMRAPAEYLVAVDDPAALFADPARRAALAAALAERAARTDLGRPGFARADLGAALAPGDFRAMLLGLVAALGDWYRARFGRGLRLETLGRFDQREKTPPHLDGGPDESLLLLGYE